MPDRPPEPAPPDQPKPSLITPPFLHDIPPRGEEEQPLFHFDEYAGTWWLADRLEADPHAARHRGERRLGIGQDDPAGTDPDFPRPDQGFEREMRLREVAVRRGGGSKPQRRRSRLDGPGPVRTQGLPPLPHCLVDAWKYAHEDQLLALLRAIVTEMKSDGWLNRFKAELNQPEQQKIEWFEKFVGSVVPILTLGQAQMKMPDFKTDTPLREASSFYDYFDESLTKLLASWIEGKWVGGTTDRAIDEKGSLVVFIDHLDCCLPEKSAGARGDQALPGQAGLRLRHGAHTKVVAEAVAKITRTAA